MRYLRVFLCCLPLIALGAASCKDSTPTPPTTATTTTTTTTTTTSTPAVNAPPVIESISVNPPRAEFRTDTVLNATVRDAETPVANLRYAWTTTVGTVASSGARATHRLDQPPPQTSPRQVDVTLTVTEDLPNGQTNTASRTTSFPLHDSYKEARDLANQLLGDFINPFAGPDFVVRNFSEKCRGRIDERNNVALNRDLYVIDREKSRFAITEVTFVGNPPMSNDFGNVRATCNFVSLVKATGKTELANGICSLDVFFDTDRWMLCDSSFAGTATTTLKGAAIGGTR